MHLFRSRAELQAVATFFRRGKTSRPGRRTPGAFTLLEMLVVISIMGILAALAVPSIRGLAGGNVGNTASRQLMDDLNQARLRAINGRTTVYVLFFPRASQVVDGAGVSLTQPFPSVLFRLYTLFGNLTPTNTAVHLQANELLGGQFTAYAMYVRRGLGDQFGRDNSQYLGPWHSLSEGAFIDTNSFGHTNIFFNIPAAGIINPYTDLFPCPAVSNGTNAIDVYLPFIAYDSSGRLVGRKQDINIPISVGSVSAGRVAGSRAYLPADAIAHERPVNVVTNGGVIPGVTYYVAFNPNRSPLVPVGSVVYNGNTCEVGETFRGVRGLSSWTFNGIASTVEVKMFEGVTVNWLTGRARVVRPEIE